MDQSVACVLSTTCLTVSNQLSMILMKQIDALKKLTQKELTDFFDEYIKAGVPQKKALSVRVYGSSHTSEFQAHKNEQMEPNAVQIEEIFSFRRSRPLYSSFKGGIGHVRL